MNDASLNLAPRCAAEGSSTPENRSVALVEVLLVFAVFFLQGAWPVPDVNEPYYLGKAIHFWNPDWVPGDFFLQTADTHEVFYFTFGWLSLWLPPLVLAWVGRLLTWGLLAWAWRRLSVALVPRRGMAVLTAVLAVGAIERLHMAGEWMIGGVEAKGFAFVLVLLGMEAIVRNRFCRAWLLLGGAAAFHVLVGGWAVVAAGAAWVAAGKDRPSLRSMIPALVGGLMLSLPGLIPSLALTWGADAETVREANEIYVFGRLAHHLDFNSFPPEFKQRFFALCGFGLALCFLAPPTAALRRLAGFGAGSLAIAAVGVMISIGLARWPSLEASLLRFYWFRLSDVAVPIVVALLIGAWIDDSLGRQPRQGRALLGLAIFFASLHLLPYVPIRLTPVPPRAFRVHEGQWRNQREAVADYLDWTDVCAWIADPKNIPRDARFITPMMCQTFKWYAGRAEVAVQKELPQDAASIVAWWRRLEDLYAVGSGDEPRRWCRALSELPPQRLAENGARYSANYLLTSPTPPLPFDKVYANRRYAVYRLPLDGGEAETPGGLPGD